MIFFIPYWRKKWNRKSEKWLMISHCIVTRNYVISNSLLLKKNIKKYYKIWKIFHNFREIIYVKNYKRNYGRFYEKLWEKFLSACELSDDIIDCLRIHSLYYSADLHFGSSCFWLSFAMNQNYFGIAICKNDCLSLH